MRTKICGHEWYIHLVDPEEIEGNDGKTVAGSFEIKIARGLFPALEKIVLVHEVSHAILGCSALCIIAGIVTNAFYKWIIIAFL